MKKSILISITTVFCFLGLTGCGDSIKYEVSDISDFSYTASGGSVILESYKGSNKYLEIASTYEIDGKEYVTDLNDFQIGSGPEILVLSDGITSVNNSIFNSSDVQKIFFPSSLEYLYDDTLSYLHPEDEEKIQIYYAGTSTEWHYMLKDYEENSPSISDAWNSSDDPYEKGEAVGGAIADKLNGLFDTYDTSDFNFHYKSSPNDLKGED